MEDAHRLQKAQLQKLDANKAAELMDDIAEANDEINAINEAMAQHTGAQPLQLPQALYATVINIVIQRIDTFFSMRRAIVIQRIDTFVSMHCIATLMTVVRTYCECDRTCRRVMTPAAFEMAVGVGDRALADNTCVVTVYHFCHFLTS